MVETLAELPRELMAMGVEAEEAEEALLEAMDSMWPDGPPPRWDWDVWGRPEQIWRPGPETYTLVTAGRGFGKTVMGSHATHYVAMHPEYCGGRPARGPDDRRAGEGAGIVIAGRTANDVNVTMVEEGIMQTCDPLLRPEWHKSDKVLVWPTGVRARLMSGDVPASGRGPNCGFIWADELPHWAKAKESWNAVDDTLRVASPGQHPRALITSTPLGTELILRLAFALRDGQPQRAGPDVPQADSVMAADGVRYLRNPETRVISGSSYDNAANLAARFVTRTLAKYAGTADGDQEIDGLIRLGTPGALWRQDWYQRCELHEVPELDRVGVAIDPTVSDGVRVRGSDEICEAGIIGLGLDAKRRRVYGLADRSCTAMPRDWADRAMALAAEIGAHEVWAEDNQGGEMVRDQIEAAWQRGRSGFMAQRYRKPKIILVKAHRAKPDRFALAAPAWEAGKVWHTGPSRRWTSLERQQTAYDPNRPHDRQQCDRADAFVWGVLQLLGDGTDRARVQAYTKAEGWARVTAALKAGAGR